MSFCVIFWIKDTINTSDEENFIIRNISTVATVFGLMMLYSIFINAGDLGVILFIGSIVAFLVLIVGIVIGNPIIIQTSRGYFIPIFLIFVLRTFIYEPYQIPSGSMLPGLQKGDFLVVNKNSYGLKVNRTGVSSIIKNDPEYGDFWLLIYNEYKLSKKLILRLSGFDTLMENEPANKASIETREKIVLPLITIQQYALRKIKDIEKGKLEKDKLELFEKMVTRSLFGNINASRNSA